MYNLPTLPAGHVSTTIEMLTWPVTGPVGTAPPTGVFPKRTTTQNQGVGIRQPGPSPK